MKIIDDETIRTTAPGAVEPEDILFHNTDSQNDPGAEPMMSALADPVDDEGANPEKYMEAPFLYAPDTHETVSLNEGTLQYRVTDFVLPGRNGFDLAITRIYDSGNCGETELRPYWDEVAQKYISGARANGHFNTIYGLGFGWRFAFPSIEAWPDDGKLPNELPWLHLANGQNIQFEVTGNGSSRSYKLKDYALEDVRLQYVGNMTLIHPHLTKPTKDYNTVVTYKNNHKDYFKCTFSAAGHMRKATLVGRQDHLGNTMLFTVAENRGIRIYDSWGRNLHLKHSEHTGYDSLTWTFPDGKDIVYHARVDGTDRKHRRLWKVFDRLRRQTTYNYDQEIAQTRYSGSEGGAWPNSELELSGNEHINIRYVLLSKITHPTGAVTNYAYGHNGMYNAPLQIKLNAEGGFKRYFAIMDRYDELPNDTTSYNLQAYEFSLRSGNKRIRYARVFKGNWINPNVMLRTEFDKFSREIAVVRYHSDVLPGNWKVMSKTISTYRSNDSDNKNEWYFRLVEGKTQYQTSTATGAQVQVKQSDFTYDRAGNITEIVETYPGIDAATQTTTMTYHANNMLNTKTVQKDSHVSIQEKYTLNENHTLVVKAETLQDDGGGSGFVCKARTEYVYATTGHANNCVTEEKRFTDIAAEEFTRHTFEYTSPYTHAPTKTTVSGVCDPNQESWQAKNISTCCEYNWWGQLFRTWDGLNRAHFYRYDALGRQILELLPDIPNQTNMRTTKYMDDTNQIETIDEAGNKTRYIYTALGQISRVQLHTNPTGEGIGNLPPAAEPEGDGENGTETLLGIVQRFLYDPQLRLQTEFHYGAAGNIDYCKSYAYDLFDRVTEEKWTVGLPGGMLIKQTLHNYDDMCTLPAPGALSTNVFYAHTTTRKGNAARPTQEPDIVSTSYTDLRGLVHRQCMGNTVVSKMEYDKLGNLIGQYDASGNFTEYQHDHAGRVVTVIAPDGSTQHTGYDAQGRKIYHRDALENNTEYEYDTAGRMIHQKNSFAVSQMAETMYYYDACDNLVQQDVLTEYDGNTPIWRKTGYIYDARGRQTAITQYTDDHGNYLRTQYAYDSVGNRISVSTGLTLENKTPRVIRYNNYDRFGNAGEIVDAEGGKEVFHYSVLGRLLNKISRKNEAEESDARTFYTYDALGRQTVQAIATPSAHSAGQAVWKKTRQYTLTGALRSETLVEENKAAIVSSYAYNSRGLLAEVIDWDGTRKRYDYDDDGRRARFTMMHGSTAQVDLHYSYDQMGRLHKVWRHGVDTATAPLAMYCYDLNGNLSSIDRKSGLTSVYQYNRANLVTRVANQRNGPNPNDNHTVFTYEYSLDGNQTLKTQTPAIGQNTGSTTTTYIYDRLGRLIRESTTGWQDILYTYDRFSNREKMEVFDPGTYNTVRLTNYLYDNRDQLVRENTQYMNENKIATVYYWYDADGNQLQRQEERLTPTNWDTLDVGNIDVVRKAPMSGLPTLDRRWYNEAGQLVRISVDGRDIHYRYGPDGLRIEKRVRKANGTETVTTHHWDGQNMVLEAGASGVVKRRYLRGTGLLAQDIADDGLYYYTFNAHGDVVQRVKENGTACPKYAYDAFGNQRDRVFDTDGLDTDPNPFRYCGEYYQIETNDYYLRARSYDPTTGRFTSEDCNRSRQMNLFDPGGHYSGFMLEGGVYSEPEKGLHVIDDPLSLNLYTYANNDPVQYADSNGQSAVAATIATGGFLSWLGGVIGGAVTTVAAAITAPVVIAVAAVAVVTVAVVVGVKIYQANKDKPDSLPTTGKPGSTGVLKNPDGTTKQERKYGPDGRAEEDTDHNHPGKHQFPHRHRWDWDKNPPRGPAEPVDTGANTENMMAPSIPAPNITTPTTSYPAASGSSGGYVVRPGDSFWTIAASQMGSGMNMYQLAAYNGMSINSTIHPGMRLRIPR